VTLLPSPLGPEAVLIPVKAFARAKLRLAPALSPSRRASLAREMATRVVESAGGLTVAVVCDDDEVAVWAESVGAIVLWQPGRGLNGAVQKGVSELARLGAAAVVVAAGDLPLATELRWITRFSGITLVPDRHHDGTNVIGLPTAAAFTFSYGPGSFLRHLREARNTALPTRVVHSSPLAWDVDLPADLAAVDV
jgi:2-phospho-L-lactate guanylyltransferase